MKMCQWSLSFFLLIFLVSIFGSTAHKVSSERSSQDNGFSIMAQHVMQTAMKLPPHILPTIDELERSDHITNRNVGVYVPHKKKAVGIYVPKKNSQKKSPSPNTNVSKVNNSRQPKRQKNPFKTKTRETQQQLTPPKRHKRKIPLKSDKKPPGAKKKQPHHTLFSANIDPDSLLGKLTPKNKRPIFKVSLDPDSPLGKLYEIEPKDILSKLPKVKLHKPTPGYLLKKHYKKSSDGKPKRRQISRPISSKINKRPRPSSDLPPPYQFENPAISDINESPSYEVGASEINRHDGHDDDYRLCTTEPWLKFCWDQKSTKSNVHKYIPNFVKVALAKSFLKDPDTYIKRLYSPKKTVVKNRNNIIHRNPSPKRYPPPNPHSHKHSDSHEGYFNGRPPRKTAQLTPPVSKNSQNVHQNTFNNLQFNEEFPWEKNILQPFGTWNDFKKGSQVGLKNWRDKNKNKNKVDRNRERSYSVHEGQNKERLYSAAVHEGRRDSFEIINQQRHDSLEDDDHTHHTHLCFCCDDVPFLADDLQRKRKKRTVKIDNPEHSSQILNHQNYIHHNMECVDQDPIEVILVFDEDGHGQHYSTPGNNRRMDTAPPPPVTLPPQLAGSLGQNYMDYKYDPIKLHHLSKANAANLLKRKTGQTLTSTESEVNKQLTGSAIVDNLFAGSSKQNSFSSPIKLQDPAPSALSIIEEYLEEELLGPYTTSKYAEYDESPHPSPSNSENADVSQNSLIKSPFHQNVLTPTVELDSSSTRNPIQQQQYKKNSVTSTESLYNGYNRLRFITGG